MEETEVRWYGKSEKKAKCDSREWETNLLGQCSAIAEQY
jgi:hypothetical protein